MMELAVFSEAGERVGSVSFDEAVLGAIRKRLMHEYVIEFEANQRRGTHSTKTIADVQGSGKKMYRQKGTGNARAHYRRSNIRVGGGVAMGPKPNDHHYSLPRKAKREALKSALLTRLKDNEVVVIEDMAFDAPKSNRLKRALKANNVRRSALIVVPGYDKNLALSARNIENVNLSPAKEINAYTILRPNKVVFMKSAIEGLAAWISVPPKADKQSGQASDLIETKGSN
ncbi:MAG: 50S ribosomal protein L4 [Planctomycetota bacterium]